MRTEMEVLAQFDEWAGDNDLVRAAVLTSTRADPTAQTDFLSDYDIELYVADLEPFLQGDGWLAAFGSVMVRWPYRPQVTFRDDGVTRLVLFSDGVRIDFQISADVAIAADAYDGDIRVLVDKDGLTEHLSPPTHTEHLVKKPTADEYEKLVHEFWWDAHYVPKYLWRDELPFAASMMAQSVRDEYLKTVLDWSIGLAHDWTVNTGVRGKKFKQYLDTETWRAYESTLAGADLDQNWNAFFNAVALFRKTAKFVAQSLGYTYPEQVDREMSAYYERIHLAEKE